MKIALLGDTHWGCRNDLSLFYNHFDRFYSDFVEHLVDEGITHVIQLGDLFDRRKYINFKTLNESKRLFFDRLRDAGIFLHVLVGNHDIHFRETVEINSPSLVLGEYRDCVQVYTSPATVDFDGTKVDIIPWICRSNEKQIMEFIANSKSDICAGHFEIANFSMYKGVESHGGLDGSIFAKYEQVWSGHYHTRSHRDNIYYMGVPYEMTWQDFNDPKGYHIFDTDTRELVFYANLVNIFVRLDYDDKLPISIAGLDYLDLVDKFVKVVVTNKTDIHKFDQFIQKLYTLGCYEIKIVEDMSEFADGEIGEEIDLEDTITVLNNYIDSIATSADKTPLKTFLKTLYVEAINLEVV